MPQNSSIYCSSCTVLLPLDVFNTDHHSNCPNCEAETYAFAFPALVRPMEQITTGEQIIVDGDAGCFYHPEKKAVLSCNHCGRFLCALCDFDFNGKHLCASCLEAGEKKKSLKNLEKRRVLYDDIALALAILPMVFFYFTILTAPIAIFLAIRHWNSPSSIIPRRSKLRMSFAILISVLQIAGWILLIIFLVNRF